jgi:hypothetical protein
MRIHLTLLPPPLPANAVLSAKDEHGGKNVCREESLEGVRPDGDVIPLSGFCGGNFGITLGSHL